MSELLFLGNSLGITPYRVIPGRMFVEAQLVAYGELNPTPAPGACGRRYLGLFFLIDGDTMIVVQDR